VFIGSATRTAPPCNNATPAAAAESFAMAILSDIDGNLVCLWWLAADCPQLHLIQPPSDGIKSCRAIGLTIGKAARARKSARNREI
jgi:hypothetical protein